MKKSDDCAAGVRFVYREYDYRLNWTTQSLITNQITISDYYKLQFFIQVMKEK